MSRSVMIDRLRGCRRALTLAVVWGCLCLYSARSDTGSRPEHRHVLLLHSYHQGYDWTDSIHRGFLARLGGDGAIQVHVEYMDANRYGVEASTRAMDHFLAELFPGVRDGELDALVCTDDPALDYLLSRRDRFFPGVPLLFCGANSFDQGRLRGVDDVTGVNEEISVADTIRIALHLRPQARRFVLVGDVTATGKRNIALFDRAAALIPERMGVTRLIGLEPATLEERLAALSADDIVLYLSYLRTASGENLDLDESLRLVTEASPAPVFGCWDFLVGRGVIGGRMVCGETQGRSVCDMLRAVLSGTPISQVPVRMESPNEYVFDYRVMRRFGIAAYRLPRSAVVVGRESTFLAHNWPWLAAGLAVVLLETLLILLLQRSRARWMAAEQDARRSEDKWRAYFDNAPLAVLVVDEDRRCLEVNAEACRWAGLSQEQMIGMSVEGFVDPSCLERAREILFDRVGLEGRAEVELPLRSADGPPQWFHVTSVRLGEGRYLALAKDVDEERWSRELLRAQRDLALALADAGDMETVVRVAGTAAIQASGMDCGGVYLVDPGTGALDLVFHTGIADSFVSHTRHIPADSDLARRLAPGSPICDALEESPPQFQALYRQEGLRSRVVVPFSHAGRLMGCLNVASHTRVTVSRQCLVVLEAITGQIGQAVARERSLEAERAAHAAFLESKARYETLFNATTDALYGFFLDDAGMPECFFEVNDVACRQLGYSREALLGMTVRDVDSPSSRADIPAVMRELQQGGTVLFQQVHRTRDGRDLPVEIHARSLVFQGRPAVLSVVRDISDRLRQERERERLEQQLQQTQKLESLGVLAGGIAHDFNNLLMAVMGHAELALELLGPDSSVDVNLRAIRDASARGAELCHEMLAYAVQGSLASEPFDLNPVLEEMMVLLRASIPKSIQLVLDPEPALPWLEGNVTQIRQVLMNLVINASDAIGSQSGEIRIRTGLRDDAHDPLADLQVGDTYTPGRHVCVEVRDNGCGMDAHTMEHLFEPFFTTKFTGRGLGMSAVLGIVKSHHGAIRVTSEPGQGSTFTVSLPAFDASTDARVTLAPAPRETGALGALTVLVADDEDSVLFVAQQMLEHLGHRVVTATNGAEAVELYRANAGEIDLVMLDMTMPVMDGVQALNSLKALDPGLRVVLSSGYTKPQ
jgi:PAS domain S-box-containing protein